MTFMGFGSVRIQGMLDCRHGAGYMKKADSKYGAQATAQPMGEQNQTQRSRRTEPQDQEAEEKAVQQDRSQQARGERRRAEERSRAETRKEAEGWTC